MYSRLTAIDPALIARPQCGVFAAPPCDNLFWGVAQALGRGSTGRAGCACTKVDTLFVTTRFTQCPSCAGATGLTVCVHVHDHVCVCVCPRAQQRKAE